VQIQRGFPILAGESTVVARISGLVFSYGLALGTLQPPGPRRLEQESSVPKRNGAAGLWALKQKGWHI